MNKNKEISEKRMKEIIELIYGLSFREIKQANDDSEFYNAYDKKGRCLCGIATLERLQRIKKKHKDKVHKIEKINKQGAFLWLIESYRGMQKLFPHLFNHPVAKD